MENEKSIFTIHIEEETSYQFLELAKWAKVLGILGMIFIFLFMVLAFYLLFTFSNISQDLSMWGFGVYLFLGFLFIYPSYAIIKSGIELKKGIQNNNQHELNKGIAYLKNSFKYMGILLIVLFCLYTILFIYSFATKYI